MPTDLEQGGTEPSEEHATASRPGERNGDSLTQVDGDSVGHSGEAAVPSTRNASNLEGRTESREFRLTWESGNMVLLGLLASFVCIFTWAWVDAFQKVKAGSYDFV